MIENIHCSQKIFCIDACYAGGFVDELSGDHSVVNVPVTRDAETIRKWRSFDFFSYAWGTAVRGKHPKDKYQPYYSDYNIGEHPDLKLVYPEWDKPDTLPDLLSFGGNGDGFIQLGEAFSYAKYLDGQTQVSGIEYNNDGFRGDLLTLNGIEGRVDTSQNIVGNYLIGRKLTLSPNVILSKGSGSALNLYLNDSTQIFVSDSSKLDIKRYSSKLIGCSGESFIQVDGNLGDSLMNFNASPGARIKISINNPGKDYNLKSYSLDNVDIKGKCNSLSLYRSSFVNSTIDFSNGDLSILSSLKFDNSSIRVSQPGSSGTFLEIYGNEINNDTSVLSNAAITIEDYPNFLVKGNTIHYQSGRGIELFKAGWDGRGEHIIFDNTIELDDLSNSIWYDLGIHSYFSNAIIQNNRIKKNSYGIVGFHHSSLEVIGDSTAKEVSGTQFIGYNTRCQGLFNYASFPYEFHWNVIRDTSTVFNLPYIKAVEYDEFMNDTTSYPDYGIDTLFYVEHNCWQIETDPSDRLIPEGLYKWRPVWCPGKEITNSVNEPKTLFYQAIGDIKDENYTQAESGFKQILSEYPENSYAQASLKGLFALNPAIYDTNYSSLKSYCDSLAFNPGDSLLGKSAEWFSIACNIKNKSYQQAINSLDSILSNPGTYADSIFALIDLSEVFADINDSTGLKSALVTRNPRIIPASYKKFIAQRKDWIDLLLKSTEKKLPGNNITPEQPEVSKPCKITSIHPNPANNFFTIEYLLENKGRISFSLISNAGKTLFNYEKGNQEEGHYSEIIENLGFPEGIYFITIAMDNVVTDARKIIISR